MNSASILANPLIRELLPTPRVRPDLPAAVKAVLAHPVEFYQSHANAQPTADDRPLTNVAFVLDRSSSMELGKATTIEGFNAQVKVVRDGAKEAGETTFTEVFFGSTVSVNRVAGAVEDIPELTDENYLPSGMTALYDALGDTIAALLETRRMDSPATATLVTLFTDGGENSSFRYDAHTLSELVKRLEATGRWTFALVGPTNGVSQLADLLSVKRSNVAGYNPNSVQERHQAFGMMASASTSYMSMRSNGFTQAADLFSSGFADKE